MTVLIEEERSQSTIFIFAGALAVLFILGITAYYLFFSVPPVIDLASPKQVSTLGEVSAIGTFDVTSLEKNAVFRMLVRKVPPPVLEYEGRPNPFLPYR